MAAIDRFREGDIDVVVTDLNMPDIRGDVVLKSVKRTSEDTPVLILTANASVEEAVDFLGQGADDFVEKPVTRQLFRHRVGTLVERVRLAREVRALRSDPSGAAQTRIVGSAPRWPPCSIACR